MSNMPMVPGGVSSQEVDQMKKWNNLMNGLDFGGPQPQQQNRSQLPTHMAADYEYNGAGGYSSFEEYERSTYDMNDSSNYNAGGYASSEDVNAMKKILESFYNAVGDEALAQPAAPQQRKPLIEDRTSEPRAMLPKPQAATWKVVKSIVESNGGKSVDSYQVTSGSERFPNKFVLKESALSVAKLMNGGYETDSQKVRRVVEMDQEFAELRRETAKLKKLYDRSMSVGEREAADVFAKKHQTAKANALAIKSKVESIWEILE